MTPTPALPLAGEFIMNTLKIASLATLVADAMACLLNEAGAVLQSTANTLGDSFKDPEGTIWCTLHQVRSDPLSTSGNPIGSNCTCTDPSGRRWFGTVF